MEKERSIVTRKDLKQGLLALGIQAGMKIIVHSSLWKMQRLGPRFERSVISERS